MENNSITKSNQLEVLDQEIKTQDISRVESFMVDYMIETNLLGKKRRINLLESSKLVLRWCSADLYKKLNINLKLSHKDIRFVHNLILGEDANVYGHGLILHHRAVELKLSQDIRDAFMLHDADEWRLIKPGIERLFDYETKTKPYGEKEAGILFVRNILRSFSYTSHQIFNIIQTISKEGHYGKLLEQEEYKQFSNMSDHFDNLLENNFYNLQIKIEEYLDRQNFTQSTSLAEQIVEYYRHYLQLKIFSIKQNATQKNLKLKRQILENTYIL